MPVSLATLEAEIRKIVVRGQRGEIVRETRPPISKMVRAKWNRGVAQALESLLCDSETLSSNPSYPQPQRKRPKASFPAAPRPLPPK
jgi:hypothetical protein